MGEKHAVATRPYWWGICLHVFSFRVNFYRQLHFVIENHISPSLEFKHNCMNGGAWVIFCFCVCRCKKNSFLKETFGRIVCVTLFRVGIFLIDHCAFYSCFSIISEIVFRLWKVIFLQFNSEYWENKMWRWWLKRLNFPEMVGILLETCYSAMVIFKETALMIPSRLSANSITMRCEARGRGAVFSLYLDFLFVWCGPFHPITFLEFRKFDWLCRYVLFRYLLFLLWQKLWFRVSYFFWGSLLV